MAQLLPSNNIFALLTLVEAIKDEPYDPAEAVPHVPLLLVAGEQDERLGSLPGWPIWPPRPEPAPSSWSSPAGTTPTP